MVEPDYSIPPEPNPPISTNLTWFNPSHSLKIYFINDRCEYTEKNSAYMIKGDPRAFYRKNS
jgi:hypothetical protein